MGVIYNGGVQTISEPTFVREIDVTSAAFDGTDTANIADSLKTAEANGSKFNPWKKNGGFVVLPSADGTINAITWEDYERNEKTIDDSLAQDIIVTGGIWNETRIVKVLSASTVKTMNIGQVL